jgi:predicted small lipoprotein YifL
MKKLLVLLMFLCLTGCAGRQSPVLYPNEYMKSVGEPQTQSDIEECSHLAEAYVKANPGAKVVGDG